MTQIHKPIEIPAIKVFTHPGDDLYVIVVNSNDIENVDKSITAVPSSIFYTVSAYLKQQEIIDYMKEHEDDWFDKDISRSFRKKAITDCIPIKEHLSEFIQKNFDLYVSNSLWCFGL